MILRQFLDGEPHPPRRGRSLGQELRPGELASDLSPLEDRGAGGHGVGRWNSPLRATYSRQALLARIRMGGISPGRPHVRSPSPRLVVEHSDGRALDRAPGARTMRVVRFWVTRCKHASPSFLPCLAYRGAYPASSSSRPRSTTTRKSCAASSPMASLPRSYRPATATPTVATPAPPLPDSRVQTADSRLVQRAMGARAWSTDAARRYLRGLPNRYR